MGEGLRGGDTDGDGIRGDRGGVGVEGDMEVWEDEMESGVGDREEWESEEEAWW